MTGSSAQPLSPHPLHSPNSLAERGKIDKAKRVLQSVRGVDDVEVEFQDIIDAVDEVCSYACPYHFYCS